jgi:hypothetical protein
VRRVLVVLVAVATLVVPSAAAAPVSGGTNQTLEPGWNVRWLSRTSFKPRTVLRVTVSVDDAETVVQGRLPLRIAQTVDGVTWEVRSPLYPDGRRRLSLRAGNGRTVPVTVRLRWYRVCRPDPCVAPIP